MTGELILCIVACCSLLFLLFRVIFVPDHPFETKKQYEKEQEIMNRLRKEQEEIFDKEYPTLVSRMSEFFRIPEDRIKEEIRSICNETNDKET